MSHHLEIGMTDPVTNGSLGTGEEIVEDSDFMAQKHQTVDKMRAYETGATCNKDALALGRWNKPDRGEAR